jgi:hypothetical protein
MHLVALVYLDLLSDFHEHDPSNQQEPEQQI